MLPRLHIFDDVPIAASQNATHRLSPLLAMNRRNLRIEKRCVAGRQDVFADRPQQPQRHVTGIIAGGRHGHAVSNNSVRD